MRDKTHHSQETGVHVPSGIRVHNPRKRAAADPGLRPRGYRDQPEVLQCGKIPRFSEKYLRNLYLRRKTESTHQRCCALRPFSNSTFQLLSSACCLRPVNFAAALVFTTYRVLYSPGSDRRDKP